MANTPPISQPSHASNGQAIFAALRDALAELYAEETTARVVVDDAGLDAGQIAFSARAQTNWHHILTAAVHQQRLDDLLAVARTAYPNNPRLDAAYTQYAQLREQGGQLTPPAHPPTNNAIPTVTTEGGAYVAHDVSTEQGDFVGRDKHVAGDEIGGNKIEGNQIDERASQGFLNRPTAPVTQHFGTAIYLGPLKVSKPVAGILFTSLVAVVLLIGSIALYTRGTFQAITAPTPTPTSTIPTATPTNTPPPTATPLAFATQAVSETLIVIATFHNTAANNSEAHTKIRRALADAASHDEQQVRVAVEPTELTADQRAEAEALGNCYHASMVIWGEDTGVEVIVNFLNLREPDFDAAMATIVERERIQVAANPDPYARFITEDLPQQMTFFALFAIGQSYYQNENYPVAIARIEAAVALVPPKAKPAGLADAYFRLGWLYQVSTPADLIQAIANYNQAIHLDPDLAAAYNNRGLARDAQGQLEAALADYDQAIRLNPDYADAYIGRGNAHYAQGQLDTAIADYDQAIRLKADYAKAYIGRGLARKAQGQLDTAIADYDQAIHLKADLADAYNNRGLAHYAQGQLDAALADYDQAIRLNPDNAYAYIGRGNAQGQLAAAIADYDQAIHLKADLADAYNNRGLAHYAQGQLDAAIADYDQAIQLKADYAEAYHNRGNARYVQGKLDAAIADYDQAIHLNPDLAEAYHNRGNARKAQGQLAAAIADYDQAIQLKADYAEAYHNRGNAYADQGKLDAAIADYDQAIRLDPNNAGVSNSLCWTYALLQQPKLALPHCQHAIALDPYPNYYDSRGLANALLGNFSAAIADFQTFVDFLESSNNPKLAKYLEKRKAWIADLQAGKNPFTEAVLEELQHE